MMMMIIITTDMKSTKLHVKKLFIILGKYYQWEWKSNSKKRQQKS